MQRFDEPEKEFIVQFRDESLSDEPSDYYEEIFSTFEKAIIFIMRNLRSRNEVIGFVGKKDKLIYQFDLEKIIETIIKNQSKKNN